MNIFDIWKTQSARFGETLIRDILIYTKIFFTICVYIYIYTHYFLNLGRLCNLRVSDNIQRVN